MMRRRAGGDRPPVEVQAADERADAAAGASPVAVDVERYATLASQVLAAEGVFGPAELTLTFVDEATMADLNGEHMGEEGPTDVLAFPLDEPGPGAAGGVVALLGDVVVCPAVAQRYAAEHGRSTEDELALLVVHGILHVLGHDHAEPDEAARMREHEQRHLAAFAPPAEPAADPGRRA